MSSSRSRPGTPRLSAIAGFHPPARPPARTHARPHARALAERSDSTEERERGVRRLCEWMPATATHARLRLAPATALLRRPEIDGLTDGRVPFTDDRGATTVERWPG